MSTPSPPSTATDLATMRRHVALNAVAWVVPAALAVLATPALAHRLGPDRFGLLSIGWAATALYAVLDAGAGRFLTSAVARGLASGRTAALCGLIWTSTWVVTLSLGVLAVAGGLAAPVIVDRALQLPVGLRVEAVGVLRLLALALPVVVVGILWRAVLEGAHQFDRINWLRLPLNLVTWGAPWLLTAVTSDVRVLVGVVVAGRAAYLLAHLPLLSGAVDGASRPRRPDGASLRDLLRHGRWLAVSGVVSPLLVHFDRLLLPLVASVATIGWYVAAGDGAMRLWLFTAALQPVLFAAIAAAVARDRAALEPLVERATIATVGLLFPVALALAWWADPLLRWWLDAAFAEGAVPAFRGALAAVFANAVAQVAYAALQAAHEDRLVSGIHLAELVGVGVAVPWVLPHGGALGLLALWASRLMVDAVVLWGFAWRRLPETRSARPAVLVGGVAGTLLLLATLLR